MSSAKQSNFLLSLTIGTLEWRRKASATMAVVICASLDRAHCAEAALWGKIAIHSSTVVARFLNYWRRLYGLKTVRGCVTKSAVSSQWCQETTQQTSGQLRMSLPARMCRQGRSLLMEKLTANLVPKSTALTTSDFCCSRLHVHTHMHATLRVEWDRE